MADFKTHLSVATIVVGFGSTSLFVVGLATRYEAILYLFIGAVGGFLPDIDSDTSTPVKLSFNFFAIIFSFLAMFSHGERYSVVELVGIWLAVFLFIKIVVFNIFTRFTVHRGIFHSIPAGIFFCFMTAALFCNIFKLSEFVSWMSGLFILIGYMVHLILDEVYSVDVFGVGLKQSFGSAVKLFDKKGWKTTIVLYAGIIVIFLLTPDYEKFMDVLFNTSTYHNIGDKFLPNSGWYQNVIHK